MKWRREMGRGVLQESTLLISKKGPAELLSLIPASKLPD